ncbi:hypothetical protein M514_04840 [Trichuris suis]|uniref:Uncharacterized protein n=1 Tax=Trichuris suis TaxID=68888 RepID=A0A085NUK1_9BILA|nr:hypothetical protein M514_04840 [Trichuris suis]
MHAGLNQRRRSQNPEGRNPERTLTVRDFVPRDFVIRDFDMHRTRGRLSIDDSLTSSWRSSLSGGGQNPESRNPDSPFMAASNRSCSFSLLTNRQGVISLKSSSQ